MIDCREPRSVVPCDATRARHPARQRHGSTRQHAMELSPEGDTATARDETSCNLWRGLQGDGLRPQPHNDHDAKPMSVWITRRGRRGWAEYVMAAPLVPWFRPGSTLTGSGVGNPAFPPNPAAVFLTLVLRIPNKVLGMSNSECGGSLTGKSRVWSDNHRSTVLV